MTNWKALIQFKLLQRLAYTEVKVFQLFHFEKVIVEEQYAICSVMTISTSVDYYAETTLVPTVWMWLCNNQARNGVISRTSLLWLKITLKKSPYHRVILSSQKRDFCSDFFPVYTTVWGLFSVFFSTICQNH